MPDFIKLPSERVEQLRAISSARDMPIADLIAEYVRDQQQKGVIPLAVPGVVVERSGCHVTVDFGHFTKRFKPELARAFAAALRWYATPKRRVMHKALSTLAEAVSGAAIVGISRRGTSIKISEGGAERTLAPSIAVDLAAVVEAAAR
jgi:hypothetical protein